MSENKQNKVKGLSTEESALESHLQKIANFADGVDQTLSRFYRLIGRELSSSKGQIVNEPAKELTVCEYCGAPLKKGNYSVKLLPRPPLTRRIRRLLQKYAENQRVLGFYQQKLVQDYQDSKNQMKVRCFTCRKSSTFTGQSCTERLKQKKLMIKVEPVEEKFRTKKQMKKDKKKARRKQRNQLGVQEETNAGLNLDGNRKGSNLQPHPDSLQSVTSRAEFLGNRKTDNKEPTDSVNPSLNSKKRKVEANLELMEKIKGFSEDQKKKKRFASQLSSILKQEKAKEKLKETSENEKIDLKAFLTSL